MKTTKETEVKDRILDVSRKLFVEKGYTGTSIRDIATEAEVNVAMVNYYFKSKHDLFEMIFEESVNILINKIFGIIRSDLPFYDLLNTWVDSYYDMLSKNSQLPIFVLNEIHQNPGHLLEFINRRNPSMLFGVLQNRINKEIEKGTIKEIPVMNLLLSILSLSIFPFVLGGILTLVTGEKSEEYYAALEKHKKFAVQFITDAIKP